MRLIDAHKLEEEFKRIYNCDPANYQSLDWGTIKNTIRDQPEVDTVKHANWKYCTSRSVVCSNCRYTANNDAKVFYHYCPHCGAKMDDEAT